MKKEILKEFREYYYCLRDSHGNKREKPIGLIGRAETCEEYAQMIDTILMVIMDSDDISVESKLFISNMGTNISGISRLYNDILTKKAAESGISVLPVSYDTTRLRMNKDSAILEKYFGNGLLKDLVYDQVSDWRATNMNIRKFKERYSDTESYRENLDFDIKDLKFTGNPKMDSNEFFDIMHTLEPYLLSKKRMLETGLNSNKQFVDYFNYLLSREAADDDEVQIDRERLLKFLSNQDYWTGYSEEDLASREEQPGYDIKLDESMIVNSTEIASVDLEDITIDRKGDLHMSKYAMMKKDGT